MKNEFKGRKVYIAGKITGFEGYKKKFEEAEKHLISQGAHPISPAVLPPGYEQAEYLHICFSMIDVCDAVYFLDNWRDSPGAQKEFQYASTKNKQLLYEDVDPAWKFDNAIR